VPEQSSNSILVIRPATAVSNPETQATNSFQSQQTPPNSLDGILSEFDQFVENLIAHGVTVHVVQDTAKPQTPDAHFPNNWFSTHENQTHVLYPMLAPSRQAEAKPIPLEVIQQNYPNQIDLRHLPPLEGTGSLVLDRVNRHAFAAISPRTSLTTLSHWAQTLDYGFTSFQTTNDIYHTNVMMAIGTSWAIVTPEVIPNPEDKLAIYENLDSHEIIEITPDQMRNYAGNMLELQNKTGDKLIIMSESARAALAPDQVRKLEGHGTLVPCPIPTIELIGGGSVRCMIAELF
jgi:hypothetical protein